jgi:predicted dinucleotide-binding enzyme
MNIGIVGSGNVGGALGTRWAQAGHRVVFGSRNPASDAMRELVAKAGPNARAASLMEAVAAAEAVLLATPWPATRAAIEGSGDLAGKVLIDATNPLLPDLTGVECGATTSGGEWVAGWALGAKVVKAFNSVGANIMANPVFGPDRPVMFYCGDDAGAKLAVKPLIEELGFEAVDAGPLRQARTLEPFALLWISLAYAQGLGREIAFKLLRR